MNIKLRGVNPRWDELCARIDHHYPPHHMTGIW